MENENNDYYEPTIKTSRNENNLDDIDKKDLDKITAYICNFDNRYINKQQLISFLEDKIYRQELLLEDWKMDTYNYNYQKGIQFAYKNVLDFIKEGGKERKSY